MTRVTSQALNNSYWKERRQRCVIRRLRKTGGDDADVTWRGRWFQVQTAATGKARSPTVDSHERRTGMMWSMPIWNSRDCCKTAYAALRHCDCQSRMIL